jgi:hypothetical protein
MLPRAFLPALDDLAADREVPIRVLGIGDRQRDTRILSDVVVLAVITSTFSPSKSTQVGVTCSTPSGSNVETKAN